MRESEHSERMPEFYFFDYIAEKHIKKGSNPPLGGRTGAAAFCMRMKERSEGRRRVSSLLPERSD